MLFTRTQIIKGRNAQNLPLCLNGSQNGKEVIKENAISWLWRMPPIKRVRQALQKSLQGWQDLLPGWNCTSNWWILHFPLRGPSASLFRFVPKIIKREFTSRITRVTFFYISTCFRNNFLKCSFAPSKKSSRIILRLRAHFAWAMPKVFRYSSRKTGSK